MDKIILAQTIDLLKIHIEFSSPSKGVKAASEAIIKKLKQELEKYEEGQ